MKEPKWKVFRGKIILAYLLRWIGIDNSEGFQQMLPLYFKSWKKNKISDFAPQVTMNYIALRTAGTLNEIRYQFITIFNEIDSLELGKTYWRTSAVYRMKHSKYSRNALKVIFSSTTVRLNLSPNNIIERSNYREYQCLYILGGATLTSSMELETKFFTLYFL